MTTELPEPLEFCEYLVETLVPDLIESGLHYTAGDMATAAALLLDELAAREASAYALRARLQKLLDLTAV